jgi:hypothetical protein
LYSECILFAVSFWEPCILKGLHGYFLNHRVQNSSGAHPASYPMGTRGSFSGGKVDGVWSWPLTSIWCRGKNMRGAIPLLPNTPSWRGA